MGDARCGPHHGRDRGSNARSTGDGNSGSSNDNDDDYNDSSRDDRPSSG